MFDAVTNNLWKTLESTVVLISSTINEHCSIVSILPLLVISGITVLVRFKDIWCTGGTGSLGKELISVGWAGNFDKLCKLCNYAIN